MRELTSTLLAAQQQAVGTPYVKVEAGNKISGVIGLNWERLYEGSEADYLHSLTVPGDGSLVRVRLSLPGDNGRLYRQRVSSPGPESDFSSWTDTGQINCIAVAAASLGSEVFIFWINTSRELRYIASSDYGASWGSPVMIDSTPTTSVGDLSAAYKPGGDLAVIFTDNDELYIKKRVSGGWQSKTVWDKNTGELSGGAVVYGSDWNIVVTGEDSSGNPKIWSLVFGDGGEVTEGEWSVLREFATAPSDGDYEFRGIFLDDPDVFRCLYTEKFTGTESYSRPFWSHSLVDAGFTDNLWCESVPFDLSCEYGMAVAHQDEKCWLSTPFGVWAASLVESSVDLTPDVLSLRQDIEQGRDRLTVELRNDDGGYGSLPSPLGTDCRLDISPGYITSQGYEISSGYSYILDSCEYTSQGGKATLILSALGGWSRVSEWTSVSQFRFNISSDEVNVKQILEFVLARSGIRLETVSQSDIITDFYPDFTIRSGSSGDAVIRKLLSFVPDVVFMEGDVAYLVNPLSGDNSVYSYGQEHPVMQGKYRTSSWKLNRVTVEGYDSTGGEKIVKDSFAWEQMSGRFMKSTRLIDRNIGTTEEAADRGEVYLRNAETDSEDGEIIIPVNCGQQLSDVVDITDERAGMTAVKKRVTGISLVYDPRHGEYYHMLRLGAV